MDMIGGLMKTTSRLAIATAFAAFASTGVMAADLGGNCCSDLEERIAELEATTARKGNRKVSLEVSGHVHEGILIWDDGEDSGAMIGSPNYSRTRFRFKGSAKINADWSAGFLIEIGLRQSGNTSGWNQANHAETGLDVRHQALYVKSKSLGTVWLGHTSQAVDGIGDICLGCTVGSTHEAQLGWGNFLARNTLAGGSDNSWATIGAGNMVASNGARDQVLRYISPELAGFVISADWQADEYVNDDPRWSVALRYANEFNGVRIAGGIGYHEEDFVHGWGASASIAHVASGVFVAGSYGEQTDDRILARDTTDGWSVIAGIGQKLSPLGKTTFWVRYGEYTGQGVIDVNGGGVVDSYGTSEVISGGINQKIDAAAMELYVTYYHVTGDANVFNNQAMAGLGLAAGDVVGYKDFDAVLFGARIQF
jgi:predicted porin